MQNVDFFCRPVRFYSLSARINILLIRMSSDIRTIYHNYVQNLHRIHITRIIIGSPRSSIVYLFFFRIHYQLQFFQKSSLKRQVPRRSAYFPSFLTFLSTSCIHKVALSLSNTSYNVTLAALGTFFALKIFKQVSVSLVTLINLSSIFCFCHIYMLVLLLDIEFALMLMTRLARAIFHYYRHLV